MANGLSQMALARAGWAADEYWTGLAHEATGQQVTDQASVEGRTGGKVELRFPLFFVYQRALFMLPAFPLLAD